MNHPFIEDEKPIDFRELFEKYSYHWKWFVLGIVVAVTAAFLYLRFTLPQYMVSTTILIEDESSGGLPSELSAFEDLGLMGGAQKKVETQIGLLKSRSLMERTIQTLGLNTTYSTEGKVRGLEIYKNNNPIQITLKSKDSLLHKISTRFTIKALSPSSFMLLDIDDPAQGKHDFGADIQTDFGMLTVDTTGNRPFAINEEIIVNIRPLKGVSKQFNGQLNVAVKYKGTELIELRTTTTLKQKGEDLLNELVKQYNKDAVADKSMIGKNTAAFINERMRVIEEDLFNADKGIELFKTSNKLTDITSEASLALESNSALEKRVLNLNTQIKLANYVIDYVAENSNELIPANLGLSDETVNVNTQRYNELLLERSRMVKGSKSEHPVILNLDEQLSQLRRSITESLSNYKSSLQISLKDAEREEEKMSSKIMAVPKQERQYRDIQRQQQIIETLYLYLLQKREENAIALAVTTPNAKVIDLADGSTMPISPKRPVVYLIALGLGVLVPFAVLYLRFLLDNKVHTAKDIEAVVSPPVIGEIGHSTSEDKMVVNTDRDLISESFRILRTNINFMLSGSKQNSKTVFITSTLAGEGKTFISLNLARVMALSSKRVLLIGADIRKPKFNEYMSLSLHQGLTHYLMDETVKIAEVIQTYAEGGFDVLGSGTVPPNPSELLMNGRFEEIIAYGKAHYDFIIVDTAPVKMITDTLLLSQYADLSLYLVRAECLDKRFLELPEKMFTEKRLPNMAMVLNDVNYEKGGYGYGYGYGEEPTKRPWYQFFKQK